LLLLLVVLLGWQPANAPDVSMRMAANIKWGFLNLFKLTPPKNADS
jgi:hypothetical protein